jgi:hypothetical protein
MKKDILAGIEFLKINPKEKPAGGHIFYKCLAKVKPHISLEERMNLLWVFSSCEKSLKESRKGNPTYALFYIEEITKHDTEGSELLTHIKNIFILPAKAFYEYICNHDYEEAARRLKDSLQHIEQLVDEYPLLTAAGIEQYVNICRVLYKKGDINVAFSELGELLILLFTGRSKTSYWEWKSGPFLSLFDNPESQETIDFVTNTAVEKLMKEENDVTTLQRFTILFANLIQTEIPPHSTWQNLYKDVLEVIRDSFIPELSEINLNKALNLLAGISVLPNFLQLLFLSRLNDTYNRLFDRDAELESELAKYYTEQLNIQPAKNYQRENLVIFGSGSEIYA